MTNLPKGLSMHPSQRPIFACSLDSEMFIFTLALHISLSDRHAKKNASEEKREGLAGPRGSIFLSNLRKSL